MRHQRPIALLRRGAARNGCGNKKVSWVCVHCHTTVTPMSHHIHTEKTCRQHRQNSCTDSWRTCWYADLLVKNPSHGSDANTNTVTNNKFARGVSLWKPKRKQNRLANIFWSDRQMGKIFATLTGTVQVCNVMQLFYLVIIDIALCMIHV